MIIHSILAFGSRDSTEGICMSSATHVCARGSRDEQNGSHALVSPIPLPTRRSCDSRNRSQRWEAEKPATRAPRGATVMSHHGCSLHSEVSAFAETLPAFLLSARPHSLFVETARRPSPSETLPVFRPRSRIIYALVF